MSHMNDYMAWLDTLNDEELQRAARWMPLSIATAQLLDLWDLLTWPVRWIQRMRVR